MSLKIMLISQTYPRLNLRKSWLIKNHTYRLNFGLFTQHLMIIISITRLTYTNLWHIIYITSIKPLTPKKISPTWLLFLNMPPPSLF